MEAPTITRQWEFLKPWLDVLAGNLSISPQSGWHHGSNGAAPLAPRLEKLVINVEFAARMKSEDDSKKYLATLRRAMVIVALALRVEPRVWTMLRGYLPSFYLEMGNLANRRWTFRDEDIHVAFEMDTYWKGQERTEGESTWSPDKFWEADPYVTRARNTYDADAVMRCYRWLMEASDDEEDETTADAAPSPTCKAAYLDAQAKIQQLNAFRVDLDRRIPVSFIIYLVSSENQAEGIAAIAANSGTRFQAADFSIRVTASHKWLPPLFERVRSLPGVRIDCVGQLTPDDTKNSVVNSLTTHDATLCAPPRGLSLWLNSGWSLRTGYRWLRACKVAKLKLTSFLFSSGMRGFSESIPSEGPSTEGGDVERLELQLVDWFGAYEQPPVNPVYLAGELWGRPEVMCRLNEHSASYAELVQRLEALDRTDESATQTTEWLCIPGADTSVVFVVLPASKHVVKVSAADVVMVSRPEGIRHDPPQWLSNVRSLRVAASVRKHSDSTYEGLRRLSWVMSSLVSLQLTLTDSESSLHLPALLVSLPSSLQFLHLDVSTYSAHIVDTLLLAYSVNGLRVRSLFVCNHASSRVDMFTSLLHELSDPTSAIARRLEELSLSGRGDAPVAGDRLTAALTSILEHNERLHFLRLFNVVPKTTNEAWQAKAAHFHGTPVRNQQGKPFPHVCKLALLSVLGRREVMMDSWLSTHVFAFASDCLTRVVQIR